MRAIFAFIERVRAANRHPRDRTRLLLALRLLLAEAFHHEPRQPLAKALRAASLRFEIPRHHFEALLDEVERGGALFGADDREQQYARLRRTAAILAAILLEPLEYLDPAAVRPARELISAILLLRSARRKKRAARAADLTYAAAMLARSRALVGTLPVRMRFFAALVITWHEGLLGRAHRRSGNRRLPVFVGPIRLTQIVAGAFGLVAYSSEGDDADEHSVKLSEKG